MNKLKTVPRTVVFAIGMALTMAATTWGQTITRATPEAASPGDLVILDGTALGGTTVVRFFASVGGFVGTWTVDVVPSSVSATQVTAVVPTMAGFAPPGAIPPGDPVGTITTLGPGTSNSLAFFYIQATPTVTTLGTGTTQPGVLGKAVVGFTIAGGPPVPPNPGFTVTLENAVPFSVAFLALGFPESPPFPMVGDGTIVLDQSMGIVFIGPFFVDGAGDVRVNLPIPPSLGITPALQWLTDGGIGGTFVSNGLQADL